MSEHPVPAATLIATLGTEPQVVTLALDLLWAKGYEVTSLVVCHTAGDRVLEALRAIQRELAANLQVTVTAMPVASHNGPIADISTEADATATLATLYNVVRREKLAHRTVHLSIAGGRKPMAVYGLLVAQLLFTQDDRLWYLLSEGWQPGAPREMHPGPGTTSTLVPIPILRWSADAEFVSRLASMEDPWDAIVAVRNARETEARRRRREFVEHGLTPAEREVARLVAQGLDNRAIAVRLVKSEKTVANQLTQVYAKYAEWQEAEVGAINRTSMAMDLARCFEAARQGWEETPKKERRRRP